MRVPESGGDDLAHFLDGLAEYIFYSSVWAVLVWIYHQARRMPRRTWDRAGYAVFLITTAFLLFEGWAIAGMYTDDSALATGSPALPALWIILSLTMLVMSGRIRIGRRWGGVKALAQSRTGLVVAFPLVWLNLFVPAFSTVAYATAPVYARWWFDFVVAGGGLGEGLIFLMIFYAAARLAAKRVNLWPGTAMARGDRPDSGEDDPSGNLVTIFSRLWPPIRSRYYNS